LNLIRIVVVVHPSAIPDNCNYSNFPLEKPSLKSASTAISSQI
jgi:hypothetical protein